MSTTETMRERFEAWVSKTYPNFDRILSPFHTSHQGRRYTNPTINSQWEGYQAGRRDLIASSGEPVAFQVSRTDTSAQLWEPCTKELYEVTLKTGRYAGWENGPPCTVRALHFLPEGVQK